MLPFLEHFSWGLITPDQWRITLRPGVKFHTDEPWTAQAALPSLLFQGHANIATNCQPYTGNFTAELVDDYTMDIICEQG